MPVAFCFYVYFEINIKLLRRIGRTMYSFTTRVRYSELAEDKKASIVSIINYFQDCCTFEAEDGGVGLSWLKEHGTAWMLTGWQVHVIRRPRYCEEIKVTTWACDFRYSFGKRSFTIVNKDGELLVWALSDWAYVNMKKGSFEKNVPEKEIEVYGMDTPISERFDEFGIEGNPQDVILKGKIRLPEQMEELPPLTVSADNLDTNHHVNNVQCVALAKSALTEEIDCRVFRSEIKKQSGLGDTLYPFVSREEDRVVVKLCGDDGQRRIVCEFIK